MCSCFSAPHTLLVPTETVLYIVWLFWGLVIHVTCPAKESTIYNSDLPTATHFPHRRRTHMSVFMGWGQKEGTVCRDERKEKQRQKQNQQNLKTTTQDKGSWSLHFSFNTEQYSLYSCNTISRAEVRNITDRLQGVKIPL